MVSFKTFSGLADESKLGFVFLDEYDQGIHYIYYVYSIF